VPGNGKRAAAVRVWVAGAEYVLIAAINEATGEVRYFLSNAAGEPVARLLAVAFRRFSVEQGFRMGKQEAGLMDYEGRDYTGLITGVSRWFSGVGEVCLSCNT
jgi:hypothetical protein